MTTSLTAPSVADPTADTRRSRWALWGSAAGLGGILTNLALAQTVSESIRTSGDPQLVVDALSQGRYHLTALTGFATVVCLLFFAAGLHRWSRTQASDSLALRVAPLGVLASASALLVAYGVKGQLAAYLDGGFNEKSFSVESQYFFFMLDDLAGYFGWFGVTVTAGCLAWLAFRDRLVARWIGALGGVVVVVVAAFLVVFGFTGFSGVIAPFFLLVSGIGLSRMRA